MVNMLIRALRSEPEVLMSNVLCPKPKDRKECLSSNKRDQLALPPTFLLYSETQQIGSLMRVDLHSAS